MARRLTGRREPTEARRRANGRWMASAARYARPITSANWWSNGSPVPSGTAGSAWPSTTSAYRFAYAAVSRDDLTRLTEDLPGALW